MKKYFIITVLATALCFTFLAPSYAKLLKGSVQYNTTITEVQAHPKVNKVSSGQLISEYSTPIKFFAKNDNIDNNGTSFGYQYTSNIKHPTQPSLNQPELPVIPHINL